VPTLTFLPCDLKGARHIVRNIIVGTGDQSHIDVLLVKQKNSWL
jgi:hypothetical protein